MSRLTQATGFINLDRKKFTNKWVEHNLTSITLTDELKYLRKKIRKNKKKT